MRRIVFTNDKGGVGKTTTLSNLAVGLSGQGKKVLVVDMDPQADATFAILAERAPESRSGYVPGKLPDRYWPFWACSRWPDLAAQVYVGKAPLRHTAGSPFAWQR